MRQDEDALGEVSRAGRAGNAITHRTGRPGGKPAGRPTRIEVDDDTSTRRSIEMENSAAVALTDQGWQVKQNPTSAEVAEARHRTGDVGDPKKKPDYLLEGRVFDCYSPTNPAKSPRGVWREVQIKIDRLQTQRVVVNLQDWRGDMSALRKQFLDWPIAGLKEAKAITPDGDVVQIDLPDRNDGEHGNGH
jgi:hypothetical protein